MPPYLEFLKKQAEERLRERGRGRLADAPRELAMEYGFANWTRLKEHVEGLAKTPLEKLKDAVCAMEAGGLHRRDCYFRGL